MVTDSMHGAVDASFFICIQCLTFFSLVFARHIDLFGVIGPVLDNDPQTPPLKKSSFDFMIYIIIRYWMAG